MRNLFVMFVTAVCFRLIQDHSDHGSGGRGGGETPLYGLYSYVRPQRVWFFSRFGHTERV